MPVPLAAVVEVVAVGEAHAVEGVEQAQLDVVGQIATRQVPQLFQQERHRDDGRAGIEDMALDRVHARAATGHVQLFQHLHAPAPGGQANGGGEAAKPTADDQRKGCIRVHRRSALPGSIGLHQHGPTPRLLQGSARMGP